MMQAQAFDTLFERFTSLKIGVIGDVMLDTYWWGKVDRISPEAPVPVVAVTKKEQRIGGAANVALNIAALGAAIHVISITGNDDEGHQLKSLLQQNGIQTNYLCSSNERITTNKIRIISRNQHMMRLDAEVTNPLSIAEAQQIIEAFTQYVTNEQPDLVILEDYNKGVLTEFVIPQIISICKAHHVITAVDPKKKNFFAYKGVDIFKPNLHEAKEGLGILGDDVSATLLADMHKALYAQLQHHISFITLSEKGVFYQTDNEQAIIPTHIRTIADVSGAGDTVIAVASVVYAASKNIRLMAEMANIAGGLVCEEVGTVAIDKIKLMAECKLLLTN
ncbi:bifunctional heptose 7-phosphate kinase/heptose 1-phosphate adenyltransferase [Ferruginibacter yonginensis]|uniref:Bifunctional heptose 7-phosphate kinase/heptose 1-phosphate adenyltransferase n=1 Tax=Ferruginibacter yonginensis TaxID=1310416 RepID=A0ABV8QQP9_9BACT